MELKLDLEYYKDTNLKPWSIQEVIKKRVNREASVQIRDNTPTIPKLAIDSLKKSVGLKNFYQGINKFVMELRP